MQREKKTISGPLLEADFYPVFNDGRRIPTRAPKSQKSTKEQQKYNAAMATKKFIRLANANFDNTDYLMHPTYSPGNAPQSEEQARKDITNYIRRVKTKRNSELKKISATLKEAEQAAMQMPNNKYLQKSLESIKLKANKLAEPLKYIYVIEKQVYKSGSRAGRINWHFHLFITGGLSSKTLENMWKNGVRTNCNTYQPEKFGPEAAARYMSKDPQGTKRFAYSRNLEQPKTPKPKDNKISKRGVARLATERCDDKEYWEKRYKGYTFVRCYARYNEYNGHWYVSVVMYKANNGTVFPGWKDNNWLAS